MELKRSINESVENTVIAFNCTLWNWNGGKNYPPVAGYNPFNCTLWNWNWAVELPHPQADGLLIVPYGIETTDSAFHCLFLFLLIVPYGIETS